LQNLNFLEKKTADVDFNTFVTSNTNDVIVFYVLYPFLLENLREINRNIKRDRPHDTMIICGGDAVNLYINDIIYTHDFDIKYVCNSNDCGTIFYEIQYNIMKFLCNKVNEYLLRIDPSVVGLNYIKTIINLPKGAFVANNTGQPIDTNNYRHNFMALTIPYNNNTNANESVLDLKLFSRNDVPHYDCWTGNSGMNPCFPRMTNIEETILSKFTKQINNNIPIPNITVNELEYATLGYILWDTFRMVIESESTGNKKDKYRYKMLRLLNLLNNTNLNYNIINYVDVLPPHAIGGCKDCLYKSKYKKYKHKYLESKK
jgi:hypothetical protein